MKIKSSSKSSLFLIELIIAIFFFMLTTTICVQLFVKSHTISQETTSLNHAVLWTQNLAEVFTNQNGNYTAIKKLYNKSDRIQYTALSSEDHLLLLFDSDWVITNDWTNTTYYILSCYSQANDFCYEDIYIMNANDIDFATSCLEDFCNTQNLISYQRIKQFLPLNNGKE